MNKIVTCPEPLPHLQGYSLAAPQLHQRDHDQPLDYRRNHINTRQPASSEPRGLECLERILSSIHRKLGLCNDSCFYLYVVDDIDFDCQQPFLIQVLEELISNAVAAADGKDMRRIEVLATQYGERLIVQVSDNGQGMPEDIANWFACWQQRPISENQQSGLDRVALLIKRVGGQLDLVNTGNRGTRLGFFVPLVMPKDHARTYKIPP